MVYPGFLFFFEGKLKAPNPLSYGFTIQRNCNTNPHLAPVRNAWHPEEGVYFLERHIVV
jgi:hypothetical protein